MLITSRRVLPRKNLPNQGLSVRECVCVRLKCEPITGLGYWAVTVCLVQFRTFFSLPVLPLDSAGYIS